MEVAESKNLMTEGTIWKKIIFFALPLFLGNLFQQLYNTADSLIVGNFLGSNALAAVSSSGNLIFLMVGFFNGIAIGAGVVIARYFGARDIDNMQRAIHTTVAFGLVSSLVLTVLGVLLAPQILIWMDTPANVLPQSVTYFRIYFMGSLGLVMYNIFVGILQAVGDSRHPLNYLIISSIINIVLDIVLIVVFHMGVGSAAFATILSQFVSAFLCMNRLLRTKDSYRLSLRKIRFHKDMLALIIRYGLPSGLQNSIIAIANVVVQSNINTFGSDAMAGCGSYAKVEGFVFLPITSFAMALTTFTGQNLGAGQYERAKRGARVGFTCSTLLAELIGLTLLLVAPYAIALFNDDPAVIAIGVRQTRTEALFYFALAFAHSISAVMRGAGRAKMPMYTMLVCWCVIRVTYITLALKVWPDITTIFWAYPITWCLSCVVFLLYYLKADWVHSFQKMH